VSGRADMHHHAHVYPVMALSEIACSQFMVSWRSASHKSSPTCYRCIAHSLPLPGQRRRRPTSLRRQLPLTAAFLPAGMPYSSRGQRSYFCAQSAVNDDMVPVSRGAGGGGGGGLCVGAVLDEVSASSCRC
jgi:hypothetical protein